MNCLVFALFCMQYICTSCAFYYWKEYYNKIPLDAFEAGLDINKEKVYIGQALLKPDPRQGIYPTSIQQGKDVYVPYFGAKMADNFVQILCSNDPKNFEWILANSTHLHLMKNDNELVRGGLEGDSWVNIGRLKYQGGTVIGKVISGAVGNADMYFVHNGIEVKASSYEVLTYNNIPSKISVRTINNM